MRSVSQCLKLKSSFDVTDDERSALEAWLRLDGKYLLSSYDYCVILGWFTLDRKIPLSPKEAGFD